MCEGLGNHELRGSMMGMLPPGAEEDAWRGAFMTLAQGWRAGALSERSIPVDPALPKRLWTIYHSPMTGSGNGRIISADSHVDVSHDQIKEHARRRYHGAYDDAVAAFQRRAWPTARARPTWPARR